MDVGIECVKAEFLMDVIEQVCEYDVIAIDECQFFDDIRDFVLSIEEIAKTNALLIMNKKSTPSVVIISGLIADSERKKWPNVIDVYPLADTIMHCKAYCVDCADGTMAAFTKCTVQKHGQEMIGDKEVYKAVCRKHYHEKHIDQRSTHQIP